MASRKTEFLATIKPILDKSEVKKDSEELAKELQDVISDTKFGFDESSLAEIGEAFNEELKKMGKQPLVFSDIQIDDNVFKNIATRFAQAISEGVNRGVNVGVNTPTLNVSQEIKRLEQSKKELEQEQKNLSQNLRRYEYLSNLSTAERGEAHFFSKDELDQMRGNRDVTTFADDLQEDFISAIEQLEKLDRGTDEYYKSLLQAYEAASNLYRMSSTIDKNPGLITDKRTLATYNFDTLSANVGEQFMEQEVDGKIISDYDKDFATFIDTQESLLKRIPKEIKKIDIELKQLQNNNVAIIDEQSVKSDLKTLEEIEEAYERIWNAKTKKLRPAGKDIDNLINDPNYLPKEGIQSLYDSYRNLPADSPWEIEYQALLKFIKLYESYLHSDNKTHQNKVTKSGNPYTKLYEQLQPMAKDAEEMLRLILDKTHGMPVANINRGDNVSKVDGNDAERIAEANKKAAEEAEKERIAKEAIAKARRDELVGQLDTYSGDMLTSQEGEVNLQKRAEILSQLEKEDLITKAIKNNYDETNKRLQTRLELIRQAEGYYDDIDEVLGDQRVDSIDSEEQYRRDHIKPFDDVIEKMQSSGVFSEDELEKSFIKISDVMERRAKEISFKGAFDELEELTVDPVTVSSEEELNQILQKRNNIIENIGEYNLQDYDADVYAEAIRINEALKERISLLQKVEARKDDSSYSVGGIMSNPMFANMFGEAKDKNHEDNRDKASEAAQEELNATTKTTAELEKQNKLLLIRRGRVDVNGGHGNWSDNDSMWNIVSSLESDFGGYGDGLYTSTHAGAIGLEMSDKALALDEVKYFEFDASQYNMFIVNTVEQAEKLKEYLTKLQKFILASGDFRGFDNDIKGVTEGGLFTEAATVFDAFNMSREQFFEWIMQMKQLVVSNGLDKNGKFTNAPDDFLTSRNFASRFMQGMGYEGILMDTGDLDWDGNTYGSVLFNPDENQIKESMVVFDSFADLLQHLKNSAQTSQQAVDGLNESLNRTSDAVPVVETDSLATNVRNGVSSEELSTENDKVMRLQDELDQKNKELVDKVSENVRIQAEAEAKIETLQSDLNVANEQVKIAQDGQINAEERARRAEEDLSSAQYDRDNLYEQNQILAKQASEAEKELSDKDIAIQQLKKQLDKTQTAPKSEDELSKNNIAITEATLRTTLSDIFANILNPKTQQNDGQEKAPWALESTLDGIIKTTLSNISTNTEGFIGALKGIDVTIPPVDLSSVAEAMSKINIQSAPITDVGNVLATEGTLSAIKTTVESISTKVQNGVNNKNTTSEKNTNTDDKSIVRYDSDFDSKISGNGEQRPTEKINTARTALLKYKTTLQEANQLSGDLKVGINNLYTELSQVSDKAGLTIWSEHFKQFKNASSILQTLTKDYQSLGEMQAKADAETDPTKLAQYLDNIQILQDRIDIKSVDVNVGDDRFEEARQRAYSIERHEIQQKQELTQATQTEAEIVRQLVTLYEQLGRARAKGEGTSDIRTSIKSLRGNLSSVDYATDMKFRASTEKGYNSEKIKQENEELKEQKAIFENLIDLHRQYGDLTARAENADEGMATWYRGEAEKLKSQIIAETQKLNAVTDAMQDSFDSAYAEGKGVAEDDILKKIYAEEDKNKKQTEKTRKADIDNLGKSYEKLGKLQAQFDKSGDLNTEHEIKQLEQIISAEKERLNLTREQIVAFESRANAIKAETRETLEVAETQKTREHYAKEEEKARKAEQKERDKAFKDRVKEAQREVGVNSATSVARAGQNTVRNAIGNVDITDDFEAKVRILSDDIEELEKLRDLISKKGQDVNADDQKELSQRINQVKALKEEMDAYLAIHNKYSGDNAKEMFGDASAFEGLNLEDYQKQLTAAVMKETEGRAVIKGFNADTKELTYTVKTGSNTFVDYSAAVDKVTGRLVSLQGNTRKTESFLDSIKRKTKELGTYLIGSIGVYDVINQLKKGVTYVREIDSALTELKKVTDETEESYDKFLDTAAKTADRVGSTVKEIVSSTADWSRIGYSMEDAARLAESTSVLLNVSEFQSIDEATSALTSTLQAFGYTASQSMEVVDVLNEVGNNFSISSDGIATALQDSASALMTANNSYEEAVALIAAANRVVILRHRL